MIEGRVVGSQALIDVTIRIRERPNIRIECVIDTGFEGASTLPPAAIAALELPYLTELTANLADNSGIHVDVHVATLVWDGTERQIAVLALGQRPLVGTSLLAGHHLDIDFAEGGAVLIRTLT